MPAINTDFALRYSVIADPPSRFARGHISLDRIAHKTVILECMQYTISKEPGSSSRTIARTARQTMAESVCDALRDDILRGKIAPGERLTQEWLSAQFNVSRIPIREALQQLAAEGLVTLRSYSGATVTELSLAQLPERYAIGGALEGLAAERAVPFLDNAKLAAMAELVRDMQRHEHEPDIWYELNLRFHMIVNEASNWEMLPRMILDMRRKTARYVTSNNIYAANLREWHRQHEDFLAACSAGDAIEARRLAEAHWTYSGQAIEGHIQNLSGSKSKAVKSSKR
jgi:DNA-binding GntR family transcriptional regulator